MTEALQILGGVIALLGGLFSLIAGIGLVRLPDVYVRMHAATKAGALGAGLVLIALALEAMQADVVSRALAGILFLLVTAPIGAHLLGRAAYLSGVPLWSSTAFDDLAGKYTPGTQALEITFLPQSGDKPEADGHPAAAPKAERP